MAHENYIYIFRCGGKGIVHIVEIGVKIWARRQRHVTNHLMDRRHGKHIIKHGNQMVF